MLQRGSAVQYGSAVQWGNDMPRFCVNDNAGAGGFHEVHDLTNKCPHLPDIGNRTGLGTHRDCRGAIAAAKKHHAKVDGCGHCAPACNKH